MATSDVVVGLPEVTLGIIPGAGGTQRLPRVIGISRAIPMICSGERMPAQRALDLGLIDAIAEGDLRQSAVARALALRGRKQRLRARAVPAEDASTVADAEAAAMRSGKARPQVAAAIESVKSAATLPIDEALQHEREAFQALRLSPEASALRHLFFAERNAAKRPELSGVAPRPFKTIAVIGAGTMGTGIAICVLDAALDVLLVELDKEALERGRQRIADHYARQVATGKLAASAAQARQACLESTTDWGKVARVDIIIEAVFEDVIGLHLFSPANLMRLLEVVRGKETAPDALATGIELAKRLRKLPVVTSSAFGFIGNRIYAAYRRQCEFMLEEGAYPEQVDRALEAFGFAMGPFAVADMSGLDIAWRMRQSQSKSRDPQEFRDRFEALRGATKLDQSDA